MNTAQELLNENIEASIVFEYKLLKENHFSWRNTYHGTLQVRVPEAILTILQQLYLFCWIQPLYGSVEISVMIREI